MTLVKILFADDTSLSKHIIDRMTCNLDIQNDLNTIQTWANKWQVTFNPSMGYDP